MHNNGAKKVKVLVVDDSLFFRNIIQRILKNHKQIELVALCKDALEAERELKRHNPDVIACDIEMPEVRGTDFVKKVMSTIPFR